MPDPSPYANHFRSKSQSALSLNGKATTVWQPKAKPANPMATLTNDSILSKADQLVSALTQSQAALKAAQKVADGQKAALSAAKAELSGVHTLNVDADTKADALVKKSALVQVLEVSLTQATEAVKTAEDNLKAAGSAAGRYASEVAGQTRAFVVAADTATIYALVDSSKIMLGSISLQEVVRSLKSESVYSEWQRRFMSAANGTPEGAAIAVSQLADRWSEFRPLVSASGVTLRAI